MTSTLQIPAELEVPPPRQVVRRRRHGETWWQRHRATVRWAIVACIGIALLWRTLGEFMSLVLTSPQEATIDTLTVTTHHHSSRDVKYYEMTYSYHPVGSPAGADPVKGTIPITGDEYDALRGKHTAKIHVGSLGVTTLHRSAWRYIDASWFSWFAAIGLNVLAFKLFRRELLRRRQVRRLVSEGRPVVGQITSSDIDKSAWTNDAYVVKYEFAATDAAAAAPHRDSVPIRRRDYERTQKGQDVIVLYDPRHPSHSILYEFCDYRATS